MSSFEGENMKPQYGASGYTIDLHFHDNKLTIEIDKNEHSDGSIDYEIKMQRAIEQEVGCKFIRTDPEKENCNIVRAINEIFRHIKESTKKSLINKISTKFLAFEFKSWLMA